MDEMLHCRAASEACDSLADTCARYLTAVSGGLFVRACDADLLAELRACEAILRQQAVADHALLAEIERRGIAGRLSLPSTFEQQGWRCIVKDKLPWWIPPAWIDPLRKPRQNQRISRQ